MEVPKHLGGHNNRTWIDRGALRYMMHKHNCKTMIDIGCGPGGQVESAKVVGYTKALGVDGDHTVNPDLIHDFTKDRLLIEDKFDLAWSVEFLEHVPEKYIDNYMPLFKNCKHVVCSSSLYDNEHHFCVQEKSWWIDQFEKRGFAYDDNIYKEILEASTMDKKTTSKDGLTATWLERNGMYFRNTNYDR